MTILQKLSSLGQSIWYDNISREVLRNGALQHMVDEGLLGVTSNPTIFDKAISGSDSYDDQIRQLLQADPALPAGEIILQLMSKDIQEAADVLRQVYDRSEAKDGYVSIEVTPTKARDTAGTMAEAREVWKKINRPNLMVKIPATLEGLPAIAQMIREGININVTLIFSLERYLQVAEAYCAGLEQRLAEGKPIERVASVASVFVSRVDTMVDEVLRLRLTEVPPAETQAIRSLLGTAAVGNARMIYQAFRKVFRSTRFESLKSHGARVQRPLWASTGTKDPTFHDLKYVDTLIGPDTVNTVPPATYAAILDHGATIPSVEEALEQTQNDLAAIGGLGISLAEVTSRLEADGVASFEKSFDGIIRTVENKRRTAVRA